MGANDEYFTMLHDSARRCNSTRKLYAQDVEDLRRDYITGQMMNYLLAEAGKLGLAGKLADAYTTAQYVHGGAELGIREMLDHCMVMGALTYSGGSSYGKPVIHLGPVGIDNTLDINEFSENFVIYGTRMTTKAMDLFS